MHYFGKKPSVNNENQNVEHMQNFGLLNSTCGNSIKSLQVRQREIDFIKHTANTCILNVISLIYWNNFFLSHTCMWLEKEDYCRKKKESQTKSVLSRLSWRLAACTRLMTSSISFIFWVIKTLSFKVLTQIYH